MLYIGAIIGGPELSNLPVKEVLARVLSGETIDFGTSLDVVFQVPGSVFTPEFEGVRTGRLSRKENILQMQIAVPNSVVQKSADEVLEFVFDSLKQSIQLAGVRLRKAQMPFDENSVTALVERMEDRYRPPKRA